MARSSLTSTVSQAIRTAFRFVSASKGWILVFFTVLITVLSLYSWMTFRSLETLMTQNPENRPTVIYSSPIVIQKDSSFRNSFLLERLKLQSTSPQVLNQDSTKVIRWNYERHLKTHSEIYSVIGKADYTQGERFEVQVEDETIKKILINDEEKDFLILDPVMVAQISGTYKSIRDYVPLDDIPTILKEAIISIEDQRFRDHVGFDLKSLARAMWINVRTGHMAQGGSTLTQQLIKNLLQQNKKTLWRKFKELILAVLIEIRFEKEKILEKYLNEVYFGQIGTLEIHGVSDAAKYYFSKNLSDLTIAEMAFLAGVIRGPIYYSPYRYKDRAMTRKNTVLQKLHEQEYIAKEEYDEAVKENMKFSPPSQARNQAPYFVDYVKAQILEQLKDRVTEDSLGSEGLNVYTTVDPVLQRIADQSVEPSIKEVEARLGIKAPVRLEGMFVAATPKDGFIRALVGGRSYSESTYNRVLNSKRPVGSTFKPVVYLTAFIKGKDTKGEEYNESYTLDDSPLVLKDEKGTEWKPQNYERKFSGAMSLKDAFINSVNIPVIKVSQDVGLENIVDTAKKLGIKTSLPAIASLPLGTVELDAIELLQTYVTFSNEGIRPELTAVLLIAKEDDSVLARFKEQTVTVYEPEVFVKLKNLLHEVTVDGTAKSLADWGYKKVSYGKTGTTSFYRDSWFAGFSEDLVAVSWVGYDTLKEAENNTIKLTGATGALPIWASFYRKARP